jgi:hypothetical protein
MASKQVANTKPMNLDINPPFVMARTRQARKP